MSTERCLRVVKSLFSVENLVAEEALRLVILSFSFDSQFEKSYSRIFRGGTQGGGGQKWLEESAVTKFTIFFKLTGTTEDYQMSNR